MALVLTVQAGLFVRTLRSLEAVDPGFAPKNVLVGAMMVTGSRYEKPEQDWAVFKTLFGRLEALPDVASAAGLGGPLPMSMWYPSIEFDIKERPVPSKGQEINAIYRFVTPGYFRTIGTPLVSGRDFEESDQWTRESWEAMILTGLSILGLLLAAVGVHGVVQYSVARRTHEIGIELALGAAPRRIVRAVMTRGLKLASPASRLGWWRASLSAGSRRASSTGSGRRTSPPSLGAPRCWFS